MTLLTDPQTWVAVLSMVKILGSVLSSWDYTEQQWISKGRHAIFRSVFRSALSAGGAFLLGNHICSPDLLGHLLVLAIAVREHAILSQSPALCLLFIYLDWVVTVRIKALPLTSS